MKRYFQLIKSEEKKKGQSSYFDDVLNRFFFNDSNTKKNNYQQIFLSDKFKKRKLVHLQINMDRSSAANKCNLGANLKKTKTNTNQISSFF